MRRLAALALLACAGAAGLGCAGARGAAGAPGGAPSPRLALFPPTNLAGRPASLLETRENLRAALLARGVELVPSEELDAFLARHRVRYTGGLHRELALAAAHELGVAGVLLATIDQEDPSVPSFAATLRLVSAEEAPRVLWIDGAARTGVDSPGLFELGLITEPAVVQQAVVARLADGLARHLRGVVEIDRACRAEGRFAPRSIFVSPAFEPRRRYTVAVMPFINESTRPSAGDLLAADFARQLSAHPGYEVLEPGILREELLRFRIVSEGGLSLDTARTVLELLDADLVVTGTVHRYEDHTEAPVVGFSAFALERGNNEVAWQASSHAGGDSWVLFFDVGRVGNARTLSCRMIQTALAEVARTAPRPPGVGHRLPGVRRR